MRNLRLYLSIILLTWKIVRCEEKETQDPASTNRHIETKKHKNFVDPYSFDYDRANKKMASGRVVQFPRIEENFISDDQCQRELKRCKDTLENIEPDGLFAKRIINLLLSNAKFKEDGELLSGSIFLSGTKEQIQKIQEYGNGKITMREVDAIFTDIIKSTSNIFTEAISIIDQLLFTYRQHAMILTTVFVSLAILLCIKLTNWSTGKVIITFFAIGFLISYIMMWSQLLKEAEIKHFAAGQKHKEPPIQCEPEKMGIWHRMTAYFDETDQCFEYYKSIQFDPYHEATPVDVLVEFSDRLILQSIARFGSGISLFIDNSTKHLGFPLKWTVTILFYAAIVVAINLLVFSVFGGAFRVWFGPFGMSLGKSITNQSHTQQKHMIEQREPVKIITQIHLDTGSQKPALVTSSHAVGSNEQAIVEAGARNEEKTEKQSSFGTICKASCCKNTSSLNGSHVTKSEDLVNESTKSEIRRDEKGDGDC
ncbi:uncharacterized protein LOC124409248 [Diprion similis]|uniref:uncharacterized protein LOC124409248 n=1 Tax=Diprion similis TaxID=362088 RepID=UPI001EF86F66|nr:uncharacterized protein LOC124409248 [Diprion similis]